MGKAWPVWWWAGCPPRKVCAAAVRWGRHGSREVWGGGDEPFLCPPVPRPSKNRTGKWKVQTHTESRSRERMQHDQTATRCGEKEKSL